MVKSISRDEVGHIFKLGAKYSEAMNAKFMDENGKEVPFVMSLWNRCNKNNGINNRAKP